MLSDEAQHIPGGKERRACNQLMVYGRAACRGTVSRCHVGYARQRITRLPRVGGRRSQLASRQNRKNAEIEYHGRSLCLEAPEGESSARGA